MFIFTLISFDCWKAFDGTPIILLLIAIKLKMNLQVEVTAGNISEVLRIFLRARAQQEIKLHHNLAPPEPKVKLNNLLETNFFYRIILETSLFFKSYRV